MKFIKQCLRYKFAAFANILKHWKYGKASKIFALSSCPCLVHNLRNCIIISLFCMLFFHFFFNHVILFKRSGTLSLLKAFRRPLCLKCYTKLVISCWDMIRSSWHFVRSLPLQYYYPLFGQIRSKTGNKPHLMGKFANPSNG